MVQQWLVGWLRQDLNKTHPDSAEDSDSSVSSLGRLIENIRELELLSLFVLECHF